MHRNAIEQGFGDERGFISGEELEDPALLHLKNIVRSRPREYGFLDLEFVNRLRDSMDATGPFNESKKFECLSGSILSTGFWRYVAIHNEKPQYRPLPKTSENLFYNITQSLRKDHECHTICGWKFGTFRYHYNKICHDI